MAVIIFLLLPNQTQTKTEYKNKELPYVYAVNQVPLYEITTNIVKNNNGYEILEKKPSQLGYNCVRYAASQTKLPSGLSTLAQKKSHITTTTPCENCVAITNEGGVGHLSIVRKVEKDTLIIEEGNFYHGYKTIRRIPKTLPLGFIN